MEVRRREVMLLIPGRGGQDDVGEEAGARHPEVHRGQQVDLAARRLVAPDDIGRSEAGRRLGCPDGLCRGAEEMLEEVLMALRRGGQQVRPPDGDDTVSYTH